MASMYFECPICGRASETLRYTAKCLCEDIEGVTGKFELDVGSQADLQDTLDKLNIKWGYSSLLWENNEKGNKHCRAFDGKAFVQYECFKLEHPRNGSDNNGKYIVIGPVWGKRVGGVFDDIKEAKKAVLKDFNERKEIK